MVYGIQVFERELYVDNTTKLCSEKEIKSVKLTLKKLPTSIINLAKEALFYDYSFARIPFKLLLVYY